MTSCVISKLTFGNRVGSFAFAKAFVNSGVFFYFSRFVNKLVVLYCFRAFVFNIAFFIFVNLLTKSFRVLDASIFILLNLLFRITFCSVS